MFLNNKYWLHQTMCDNNSPGEFVNILLVQIYIQYITGYNVSQYILGVEMFWKCIKISTASFTASNSKLSGRPILSYAWTVSQNHFPFLV